MDARRTDSVLPRLRRLRVHPRADDLVLGDVVSDEFAHVGDDYGVKDPKGTDRGPNGTGDSRACRSDVRSANYLDSNTKRCQSVSFRALCIRWSL